MAWAFVQKATAASGSATTATFSSALTSGSLIVVCIEVAAGTVSSVTDTAGNSYSQINTVSGVGSGTWVTRIYAASNSSTQSSNAVAVSHTGGYGRVIALEYTGLETTSDNDATQLATATNATYTGFNNPNENSVVITCAFHQGTITGVTNITHRSGPDSIFSAGEVFVSTANSTPDLIFTTTSSYEHTMNVVAFRETVPVYDGKFLPFIM